MDTNDELTGTWVLVHPDLGFDGINKQGNAGIITYADTEQDEFYVGFGKETGLYAADSLMVLRKSLDIYSDMMADVKKLEKEDMKDILRISMQVASGLPKDHRAAFTLAANNPVVRSYAMETLENKLGRSMSAEQVTEMVPSRGR